MRAINDAFMSPNATVSLADGTVVGSLHRSVRYQEITGPIYRMMKDVVSILLFLNKYFLTTLDN